MAITDRKQKKTFPLIFLLGYLLFKVILGLLVKDAELRHVINLGVIAAGLLFIPLLMIKKARQTGGTIGKVYYGLAVFLWLTAAIAIYMFFNNLVEYNAS